MSAQRSPNEPTEQKSAFSPGLSRLATAAVVIEEDIIAVLCQVLENSECPRDIGAAITEKNGLLDTFHKALSGQSWGLKQPHPNFDIVRHVHGQDASRVGLLLGEFFVVDFDEVILPGLQSHHEHGFFACRRDLEFLRVRTEQDHCAAQIQRLRRITSSKSTTKN